MVSWADVLQGEGNVASNLLRLKPGKRCAEQTSFLRQSMSLAVSKCFGCLLPGFEVKIAMSEYR